MNACTVTQEEFDEAGMCFGARAELLRSKGAPIKPGECFFSSDYVVIVEIIERRVPGQFPVKGYRYEWVKKDGEEKTEDTSEAA